MVAGNYEMAYIVYTFTLERGDKSLTAQYIRLLKKEGERCSADGCKYRIFPGDLID